MRKSLMQAVVLIILLAASSVTVYAASQKDLSAGDRAVMERSSPEDLSEAEREKLEKKLEKTTKEITETIRETGKYFRRTEHPELTVSYEAETGFYCYTQPNGCSFRMDAPLGSFSNTAVRLAAGDGTYLKDYTVNDVPFFPEENGTEEERPLEAYADEVGTYYFRVASETRGAEGMELTESPGSFRILKENVPTALDRIPAPFGYRLSSARRNGAETSITDGSFFEPARDGVYELIYTAPDLPEWRTVFLRDTTPPALVFTGKISDGVAKGSVSFTAQESGARIRVIHEGEEIDLYGGRVSETGSYRFLVSDEAGNTREYDLRVIMDQSVPGIFFLSLFALLAVISIIVILTAGRSMRIL